MIKLTNLQKIYRTKEIETVALENVNLEVQQGEFLSIMGPSGCGKSTLLNIMGLLDLPTSGTVEINGVNTVGMSDKELAAFRNKQLGFVFQSFHLINSLNMLDNTLEGFPKFQYTAGVSGLLVASVVLVAAEFIQRLVFRFLEKKKSSPSESEEISEEKESGEF